MPDRRCWWWRPGRTAVDLEPNHQDGWVAAVDIGNKALKAIGRYYLPDDFYYSRGYDPEHPLCASTLSRHLDLTSGNQVSACRKKTEAKRPANHRIVTSIPVDSYERRAKIRRLLEMAGKTKCARNSPESIMQNNHIFPGLSCWKQSATTALLQVCIIGPCSWLSQLRATVATIKTTVDV
ncbi:uncharacterized protein LOC112272433 [Brachypodium distachyon]|uniref:uncharacterized protein LOC112272433 n=1 Tax=Brachypodium distachyon TaxID=15368 RepID=UPI000D0D661D|nr:uncharacterized protein LOC112272433 [Brachypodium distachyon]|eukprot:XP_024318931.1 uncharacterized protein LOC112272433 [Brachypodium distachyon]